MKLLAFAALVGCAPADARTYPPGEPTWFDGARPFAKGLAPVKVQSKWGYIDHRGAFVIKPQFDDADDLNPDGYAWAGSERSRQVVSAAGKLSAPIIADEYQGFVSTIGFVKLDGKLAVVDATTGAVSKQRYDALDLTYGCPLLEAKGAKPCIVDRTGACIADAAVSAPHGHASKRVLEKAGKAALYDCNAGALAIPFDYRGVYQQRDGRAWVQRDDQRWSLLDAKGKVVIGPLQIDQVEDFPGGITRLGAGPLQGLVINDRVVTPAFARVDTELADGRVLVWSAEGAGYIDATGAPIVKPSFSDARAFSNGLAAVRTGAKWGYIDPDGRPIIPPTFEEPGRFQGGFAPVKLGGKWGYVDRAGKLVVPATFDAAEELVDGLASATTGDRATCLHLRGGSLATVATPFSQIGQLHHGRAQVTVGAAKRADQRCGYVDDQCVIVGSPRFHTCGQFDEHGLAEVQEVTCQAKGDACTTEQQSALIVDRKLATLVRANVVAYTPEDVRFPILVGRDFNGSLAIGERAPAKTRTGLIWKGELILPVAYDSVGSPSDGFVLVTRNGKAGFIAVDGTALVAPR